MLFRNGLGRDNATQHCTSALQVAFDLSNHHTDMLKLFRREAVTIHVGPENQKPQRGTQPRVFSKLVFAKTLAPPTIATISELLIGQDGAKCN